MQKNSLSHFRCVTVTEELLLWIKPVIMLWIKLFLFLRQQTATSLFGTSQRATTKGTVWHFTRESHSLFFLNYYLVIIFLYYIAYYHFFVLMFIITFESFSQPLTLRVRICLFELIAYDSDPMRFFNNEKLNSPPKM